MRIRIATARDAAAIASIYAHYVTDSAVSFETHAPGPDEMRARIEAGGGKYPWLVAIGEGDSILGYSYTTGFRPRAAYRFAVETSVYLRQDMHKRGLGRELYAPLLAMLEAQGFAQAIAAIALPNEASVRLHERLGFDPAGLYRRVGYKLDAWWDVGLWQRGLKRPADPPVEPLPLSAILFPAGVNPPE